MTAGLYLVTSNDLETLAQALAQWLRSDTGAYPADPFFPEIVMVQSKGMQRWISLNLARINGISANIRFPFPNAFTELLMEKIFGPTPESRLFAPHILTFRILEVLPELLDKPTFEPLRNYLAMHHQPLKVFQLSRQIADTFDQYLVFRPDMVAQWDRGNDTLPAKGQSWQPILWRRLRSASGSPHRAERQSQLIHRLTNPGLDVKHLPRRVAVFGVSHLPQFHLSVLQALSHKVPVYFFLMNPCRQYWFDILSDKQLSDQYKKHENAGIEKADLHFERGNRLLASWGQVGKHFFNTVYQVQDQTIALFQDNDSATLLGRIQQDILDLVDRTTDCCNPFETRETAKPDRSVQIHACHSPMRELQVLHDNLLDILSRDPGIEPRDILVLMPDINAYAPFIHAVFGSTTPHISFSIADQPLQSENRIVEGFVRLLELAQQRFEVSKVMALLAYPAIRDRFGLKASELPLLDRWIASSKIRWGWDSTHKKRFGLPGYYENTWRFGIDRLLLGYAMISDDSSLFDGVLPVSTVEGNEAAALGSFIAFCESLHTHLGNLPRQMPINDWGACFQKILDRFFSPDDATAAVIQQVRDTLAGFSEIAATAGCQTPVCFDVALNHLVDQLNTCVSNSGFLAGRVTFCAMLPMRSIPAKVVCLLGLNHDAFPKDNHEPSFNLVSLDPRAGDRSRRNDDKYLFLESILSARETFYISYIGKDIQDNTAIPPCVLVEELIDYIEDFFSIQRQDLVTEHPLHAFSPRYFSQKETSLFSYSEENLSASRQLAATSPPKPFFVQPLTPAQEDSKIISLNDIISFFNNPCRFLLEERLGLFLYDDLKTEEDREVFGLDGLNRFNLNQELLSKSLKSIPWPQIKALMRAGGNIPHGRAGLAACEHSAELVSAFMSTLSDRLPNEKPRRVHLEVPIGSYRLASEMEDLYEQSLIHFRMAKQRPKDLTAFFLRYLALCASDDIESIQHGYFIFQTEIWEFTRPQKAIAVEVLESLLDLYLQGLRTPLPFFSRTSYAYADQILKKSAAAQTAMQEARKTWLGNDYRAGEREDPYYARCFADSEPLAETFEQIAVMVWGPIFEAGRKLPIDG